MTKLEQKHPIQPLVMVNNVLRFKENAIVSYLLDKGGFGMNKLAVLPFSREDREQFAQLIGYSHCGFGELGYASDEVYSAAELMHKAGIDEKDARIAVLESNLADVRDGVKKAACAVFSINPDDLVVS